jgi:hypothetical protein
MNGQMDALRQPLLCYEQLSWKDYKPQTPEDRLLSHTRQCWVEFCDDNSISDPVIGFKNYLQHEAGFLEYLERRDCCDGTTLGCYQRFFKHLAEKDLGGAPEEERESPLGQLLGGLQAVNDSRVVGTFAWVNRWVNR